MASGQSGTLDFFAYLNLGGRRSEKLSPNPRTAAGAKPSTCVCRTQPVSQAHLYISTLNLTVVLRLGTTVCPILHMRKWRPREVK